jgi:AcrR family transcriptional regulator
MVPQYKQGSNSVAMEASSQYRGRAQTRLSLVHAARDLVLDRGAYPGRHENISISDITRHAGVATGTFYNYFQTKQDVFEAVLEDYRESFKVELQSLREELKDPATIVATTLKFYFRQSRDNEMWNSFVTYSGLPGEHILHQEESQCLSDIERGIQAGRFKVTDVSFAQNLIIGMVKHVNREMSEGNLGRTAMNDTTQYILRMLGLPDLVARALAQGARPPARASHRTGEMSTNVDPSRNILTNSG